MVFGRGFLWVLVRLFVFYEACSPLPMGEGPGVRSGFGEAFRVWPRLFVGIGGLFAFGKQASPGNIMFDTPKHSAERVFW